MTSDMQFRLEQVARMAAEISRLREALEAIASEDYRGPEPPAVRIARVALKDSDQ